MSPMIVKVIVIFICIYLANARLQFDKYRPCKLEEEWTKNVNRWQDTVCNHISNITIDGWLNAVKVVNTWDRKSMMRYMKEVGSGTDLAHRYINGIEIKQIAEYLSHMDYKVVRKSDQTDKFVEFFISVPIEPIIGLARDPRKCYNVMSDAYTQSK